MNENYAEEFAERKEDLKREFPSQLPKQTKIVQMADRGYGKLVSSGLHLKTGGWPSIRGS